METNNLTPPAIVVVILAIFYSTEVQQANMYSKQKEEVVTENIRGVYDYVIVGGGTTGSVLAARLSENKNNSVLLLEAGGFYDADPNFSILSKADDIKKGLHDWGYYTTPQEQAMFGMVDNKAYWPRGKVLGGTSLLSDGLYVRGNRFDYDSWAKKAGDEWSYKNVLPYFLKTENIQSETLRKSRFHYFYGQMAVSESVSTPLADLFLKSGEDLGYRNTDYNGINQVGFSRLQINNRKGVRDSTVNAILARVRARHNLNTMINAYVTSIYIKDKRATGVTYFRNGQKLFVRAEKEVILCAGAIKTPQLLMLSGIGPKKHLNEMNIPLQVDLPVGQYLQDHLAVPLISKVNTTLGYISNDFNNSLTKLQYKLFGTGPMAKSFKEGIAFLSTKGKPDLQIPDVFLIFSSMILPLDKCNFKDEILRELSEKFKSSRGFTVQLALTKPLSMGSITLHSRDPFDAPILNPQYLVNDADIKQLVAGIKVWEKLMSTPTMKAIGADADQMEFKFCGQHSTKTDAYRECLIRHLASSTHDQTSTCRMGKNNDGKSVVNSRLQVHGINGLRVVDASVFPDTPSGNIQAPTVMLAEKASDIIQGKDSVNILRNNLPQEVFN
ncbi:hypothetical protein ACF0H5_009494 [Mactra antiquata]